jgi:hypothetical protein
MTNSAVDDGTPEDEADLSTHEQSATTPRPGFVPYLLAPEFSIIRSIFLLAFLSNFSYYCSELPLLRLVERTICEVYYANEDASRVVVTEIEEKMCKIPKIQNDLARFMGYKTAFDATPRTHLPSSVFTRCN